LAEFHSKKLPNSLLLVGIGYSGGITAKAFETDSSAIEPVDRKDLAIDSQDALNTFAKNPTAVWCLRSCNGPIELSLTSSDTYLMSFSENDTTVPVWRLVFWRCPEDGKFTDYYLDAKTGEIIDC